ncbi:MAG: hypothetical protein M3O34_02415, partial [Chloroflexota bacterium]|nr:hypothetical protein [Chloroflexota bacterium]
AGVKEADPVEDGVTGRAAGRNASAGGSEASATLEAALGRIAELEERLAALGAERDTASARVMELEEPVTERSAAEGESAALAEARAAGLGYLRRALLAEHAGMIVPELVTGDTPDQLEASVDRARAAWDRATEAAKQALRADRVPAGAPARNGTDPSAEGLSPLGKIARGLRSQ